MFRNVPGVRLRTFENAGKGPSVLYIAAATVLFKPNYQNNLFSASPSPFPLSLVVS